MEPKNTRALQVSALSCFVGLIFPLISPITRAACAPFTDGVLHRVAWVYDGDTLKLADGRKIRLIGINTPEIGHDGAPNEPFSRVAQAHLQALLSASGDRVHIKPGRQKQDHYGRQLAHVYDNNGLALTEQLLRQGLGFSITIPPNFYNRNCYRAAEQRARQQGKELWGKQPVTKAASLRPGTHGFRLISGEVKKVRRSRGAVWLMLENDLDLRVDKKRNDEFSGIAGVKNLRASAGGSGMDNLTQGPNAHASPSSGCHQLVELNAKAKIDFRITNLSGR